MSQFRLMTFPGTYPFPAGYELERGIISFVSVISRLLILCKNGIRHYAKYRFLSA